MSSKQNIILHLDGINACESKEYEHALKLFMRISEPSAPIYFNMGCCYLRMYNNKEALMMFQECVSRDKYLAVGQFQLGVAQTLCGDLSSAADSFQGAFSALRGNPFIDYKQLNLSCKLYASEINYNLGLVRLFEGYNDAARECFHVAAELPTDSTRHFAIPGAAEAAERDRWTYFGNKASDKLVMLPESAFFRVSKAKMEGLQTSTKFMDKAKVVAAVNDDYSFVGFVGAKKLQQAANNSPSPASQSPKRKGPAVGPPPSVPPPRLPPNLTQPARNRAESPILNTVSNGRSSPVRRSSPSRPPPPTALPPKPVSKGPPSAPPPRIEGSPAKKTTERESPAGAVVSQLVKNLAGAQFTVDDKQSKASYTKVMKGNRSVASDVSQAVTFRCEFSLDIGAGISYEELMTKLAETLGRASATLSNPQQRKSMVLSVEDTAKKTKVAVTSDSSAWQRSVTKGRQSEVVLTLKESEKEPRPASPNKRYSPPFGSPGHKPS